MSEELIGRQITIPTIGTILTLTAPWVFSIYHESRNRDFMLKMKLTPTGRSYGTTLERTETLLPVGTKLVVDRIYVRKGAGGFDSVTFRLKKGDHASNKSIYGRFWVKLEDANMIECAWSEKTVKRDEKIHPMTRLAAEGSYDD